MRDEDCLSPDTLRYLADCTRERIFRMCTFEIDEETCRHGAIANRLEPERKRQKCQIASQKARNKNDGLSVSKARNVSDHDSLPGKRESFKTCLCENQRPHREKFDR